VSLKEVLINKRLANSSVYIIYLDASVVLWEQESVIVALLIALRYFCKLQWNWFSCGVKCR